MTLKKWVNDGGAGILREDKDIAENFSVENFEQGKAANKAYMQKLLGLEESGGGLSQGSGITRGLSNHFCWESPPFKRGASLT